MSARAVSETREAIDARFAAVAHWWCQRCGFQDGPHPPDENPPYCECGVNIWQSWPYGSVMPMLPMEAIKAATPARGLGLCD